MHRSHPDSSLAIGTGQTLGASEQQLLAAYPSLRAEDLVNAGLTRVPTQQRSILRFARTRPLSGPVLFERKHRFAGSECELRRSGHDVLTSLDAGKANVSIPDPEVLAFAASENRILLTHNRRHFLQLHRRRTTAHMGMVLCTFDADFAALAQRIHEAVVVAGDMRDGAIRVNRPVLR